MTKIIETTVWVFDTTKKNTSVEQSETKIELSIWGKEFSLPVEYDCYSNETVTKEQKEAIITFASHPEWLNSSKIQVEEFLKDFTKDVESDEKKKNILNYVTPHYFLVKRDAKDPRVALMCNSEYDKEHGIAVIFSCKGDVVVGSQDAIL